MNCVVLCVVMCVGVCVGWRVDVAVLVSAAVASSHQDVHLRVADAIGGYDNLKAQAKQRPAKGEHKTRQEQWVEVSQSIRHSPSVRQVVVVVVVVAVVVFVVVVVVVVFIVVVVVPLTLLPLAQSFNNASPVETHSLIEL